MIVGLRGTLTAVGPDWIHIAIGGVTLQAFVPASAIPALGAIDETVSLRTMLRVANEQPALYGFPDDASLQLFTLLTGISGVGPRLALALLSSLDPAALQLAIAAGDATAPGRRPRRRPPHRQPHNPRAPRQNRRHSNRNRNPQRQQRSPGRPSRPRLHPSRSQSRHRRHPRPRKPNHRRSHQNGPATVRPPRVKPVPAVL